MRAVRRPALALLCVSLSGCWPFLYEPTPSTDDGGEVFVDDGGTVTEPTDAGPALDKTACTFKGKKLYGKIQYVDSFPDVKIREVTALPDLKVVKVSSLPTRCGEWQVVDTFPNTRVKVVTAFEDLQVEYVTSFPGFR